MRVYIASIFCHLLCITALRPGNLPKSFVEPIEDPPLWQVHAYNDNTFILRQSGTTDYEKPFLYLLFGNERAYLFDTGSLNGHPAPIVNKTISDYLATRSSPSALELVVGHSHSHWDHTAGDSEMRNFSIPRLHVTTKFIAPDVSGVIDGYGLHSWPEKTGLLDLGSRKLDIIPIPGHTHDAIAVYDRQTGLLLTGDSAYPGRIFIPQSAIATFKRSHKRLLEFAGAHEVAWVLGCHIEQKKTPFKEYPLGTRFQPDEHVLQFPVSILDEIDVGLKSIKEGMKPEQVMFAEFSLVVPEVKDESVLDLDIGVQQSLGL